MKSLFVTILLALTFTVKAQLKPIGSWTDHLPYRYGTSITESEHLIYCATKSGLFTLNLEDNSLETYSKVNILNDVNLQQIKFSKEFKTLLIVYKNGNIDLIRNNRVTNIPFIKNSSEQGTVNEIKINGNLAYLSFTFGIIVLDIEKQEIKDTYKFGVNGTNINVNSTALIGDTLYAATDKGYYLANINNNLIDFNSWQIQTHKSSNKIKSLLKLGDKLLLVSSVANNDTLFVLDTTFNTVANFTDKHIFSLNEYSENSAQVLTDNGFFILNTNLQIVESTAIVNTLAIDALLKNGKIYMVTQFDPLLVYNKTTGQITDILKPNGPLDPIIFDMDIKNGKLWAVNGGHSTSYANSYRNLLIFNYIDGSWNTYSPFSEPILNGLFDALSVTINPTNDQVFFGLWGNGFLQYKSNTNFTLYDTSNSSLKIREALAQFEWIGTGESVFDENGNLWVTNTNNVNALSVNKTDGTWKSFNFSHLINNDETTIYDIAITGEGYKWFTLPKDNKIIVFDDNGTINNTNDDQSIMLNGSVGTGDVPGFRGIKIETDLDGAVWIGTSDGIAVHYNPSQVFEPQYRDFDRIIFNDGENNEILLKNVTIKDIAIDGANQKWIATEGSGVLLLSADGKTTLAQFNESNSPLFSNTVNAISIDQESGEVFFATANGLISYRGAIVEGKKNYADVKVFPNPVRPDYTGSIAINGLVDNSTVKITDINGTLVSELKSEGGQVLWDGNNFEGRRVSTGVYLIFNSVETDNDNINTSVGKILFVN